MINDNKHLGRMGIASINPGMYPNGEPYNIRDAYDAMIQWGKKTKTCYNCGGSGKKGGKQCTACHGSGSVPAA